MPATILVRGGGDLASGVVLRLHHAGLNVVISELEQPLGVHAGILPRGARGDSRG